jgi:hypothetical protein
MPRPTEEQLRFLSNISELLLEEKDPKTALTHLTGREDLPQLVKLREPKKWITLLQMCFFSEQLLTPDCKALFVFLQQNGADINASFRGKNHEETMLLLSSRLDDKNCVYFLLDHGANINHENKAGYNALMVAASTGNTSMCKFLLSRGADLEAKNNWNTNALRMFGDDFPIGKRIGFLEKEKQCEILLKEANWHRNKHLLFILHGTRKICNALAPLESIASVEVKNLLHNLRLIRRVFESRDLLQYIIEFIYEPFSFY